MSYCRFSDGDVYVFPRVDDRIECCWCKLAGRDNVLLDDERAAIDHLLEHRAAGHEVPQYAIERLENEMKGRAVKDIVVKP